jgi:WD40 repeat protein
MIACGNLHDIDLWDVNTGKQLRTLTGYRENNPPRRDWVRGHILGSPWIFTVVFSPDGKTIAGASEREVRLWDVNAGYLRKLISGF